MAPEQRTLTSLAGGDTGDTGDTGDAGDPRVRAVLEVLGGQPTTRVARDMHVEPVLLHRWVRAFVDAGAAVVTNTPDSRVAEQRDRFLAAFAHEFRSPLTVALGWVRVLEDEEHASPVVGQGVARLHGALDRLHERARDVELLAAASLGRLRVDRETVRVADLVAGLPGLAGVGGEGDLVEVDVDADLFRRVLRDVWHTASLDPAPRARWLEVHTVGQWVEIRAIRDADPIDPAVLRALFDPFDVNDDATGVTIGLYLARALLVAHRGTIGLEQDEHRATVWLRVPRRVSPHPAGRTGLPGRPTTQEVPRP